MIMECTKLLLVALCLVLSSLPTTLAFFRKQTRLSRMPMYYGKRSETGSKPGQHDLGMQDQHDLAGEIPKNYPEFILSRFSQVLGNVKVSLPRDHRLEDVIKNRHIRLVDNRHVFSFTDVRASQMFGTKPDTENTHIVMRVRRTSKFANPAGKRRSSILSRMPAYFGKRTIGIRSQSGGNVPENMFKHTSHRLSPSHITFNLNRFSAINGHNQVNDLKQDSETANEIKKRINDFDIKV